MSYLTDEAKNITKTPQSQPIPGREHEQVENRAGGYVFPVDKWTQLQRFLILGTEGGTYYATQREMTTENTSNLLACIREDGLRAVRVICEVSNDGRAPKNDPAIFALALASTKGDDATRKAALDALPTVCRIGTHLFMFAEFRKAFGGFGSGVHRALNDWYTDKDPDQLAYQVIKYRQRGGWSHRDILRKTKPRGRDFPEHDPIFRWLTKVAPESHGKFTAERLLELIPGVPRNIEGFTRAQCSESPAETAKLIEEFQLPREALKTEHLNSPEVWEAMLFHGGKYGMPITAMIRNLATMQRAGDLLTPTSKATQKILESLKSAELLKHARVHPIQVLFALKTYESGRGVRGGNTWTPLPQIVDALDEAFYLAFGNVEATGKRRMIALDISGSMWFSGGVGGLPNFTAAQAAAAMAMVSIKTGDPYEVVAFTSGSLRGRWGGRHAPNELIPGLSPMTLSGRQRLDDVDRVMHSMSQYMGGTDAALPMVYAKKANREVDVFEVFTDNETWAGDIQPVQALQEYRKASGINAKLVAVGLTATSYSIADPGDSGMFDVVGFDTAAPSLIDAFARDQF
jgi:60 kDa SS-A/Ro ribonucleoprotein